MRNSSLEDFEERRELYYMSSLSELFLKPPDSPHYVKHLCSRSTSPSRMLPGACTSRPGRNGRSTSAPARMATPCQFEFTDFFLIFPLYFSYMSAGSNKCVRQTTNWGVYSQVCSYVHRREFVIELFQSSQSTVATDLAFSCKGGNPSKNFSKYLKKCLL